LGQGPGQSLYTDKPVKILLVEDNLADVVFFRETLRDVSLPVTLQVVDKGEEALANLR
jgi:CheY-like chemotaxis protein